MQRLELALGIPPAVGELAELVDFLGVGVPAQRIGMGGQGLGGQRHRMRAGGNCPRRRRRCVGNCIKKKAQLALGFLDRKGSD
ncbi:hypothetical protein D3C72_2310400 [compost metagenome]